MDNRVIKAFKLLQCCDKEHLRETHQEEQVHIKLVTCVSLEMGCVIVALLFPSDTSSKCK